MGLPLHHSYSMETSNLNENSYLSKRKGGQSGKAEKAEDLRARFRHCSLAVCLPID